MSASILPYILFFDWDNTLCVGGSVSEANRAALCRAKREGHRLVLNTGRSYGFIPKEAFDCADWDGVIASCSFAKSGGKVLFEKYLPAQTLIQALAFFREHREILRYITFECRDGVISPEDDEEKWTDEYIRLIADELHVSNVTVGSDLSSFDSVPVEGCDVIAHHGYTEMVVPGQHKGSLIPMFCEYFGIPKERTAAFGDSINDVGMFESAAVAALIPGEPFDRPELADFRAVSREDGVAECMTKILGW